VTIQSVIDKQALRQMPRFTPAERPVDAVPTGTGAKPAKRVKRSICRTVVQAVIAAGGDSMPATSAAQTEGFLGELSVLDADNRHTEIGPGGELKQQNAH
jgi:hypothetical protein